MGREDCGINRTRVSMYMLCMYVCTCAYVCIYICVYMYVRTYGAFHEILAFVNLYIYHPIQIAISSLSCTLSMSYFQCFKYAYCLHKHGADVTRFWGLTVTSSGRRFKSLQIRCVRRGGPVAIDTCIFVHLSIKEMQLCKLIAHFSRSIHAKDFLRTLLPKLLVWENMHYVH